MNGVHRKLRRKIGEAIPRDWRWRREGCGHLVDPAAKWRADVLPDNARILSTGANEGVTWIRGWYKPDSKEAAALLVANALGKDQESEPYVAEA